MPDLISNKTGSDVMAPAQAAMLTSMIRNNWPNTKWTRARFALWAEALAELPYSPTLAVVRHIVRTRESEFCPPVGVVVSAVRRMVDQQSRVRRAQEERRLLVEPRCDEVRRLLRETVERLEERRAAAGGSAPPPRRLGDEDDGPRIHDPDAIRERDARRAAIRAASLAEAAPAARSRRG